VGSGPEKPYIVKSAARALAVLEAVQQLPRGKGLAQLSAELELNKSTALRLLRTLVAERILQRDSVTGFYSLDASSWLGLVPHVHPALSFLSAVQSRLDDLAAAARATTVLVLPCTARRYAVAWMHSEPEVVVHFDPSALIGAHTIPLHAAASGKCYLASLPPATLVSYLEGELEAATPHAITSPASLRKELRRVRGQGYALSEQESLGPLRTLAVPVREPLGEVMGALSLVVVGSGGGEGSATSSLPLLRDAAEAISHMLSYSWWTENVTGPQAASVSLAAEWETADPGFGDGPTPSVRSVARMMRLAATLMAHPRGMSLGELSQARGLDKATAWRLLSTLVAHDIVWQSRPDKTYHISPLFWVRQSSLMRSASSLATVSEAILQDLSDATGATATLELPDREEQNSVVYQFALPPGPVRVHPAYRPPSPLHSTAAGKCYLAAQSKWSLQNYLGDGLAQMVDGSGNSHKRFLRELEDVRVQGYAQSRHRMSPAVDALAVPLADAAGTTVGGVAIASVAAKVAPAHIREWLPLLRHAADRLSRLLVANWRD
jgi:DNA-binding IclR family transcriptional regulator